jgi:hypothetical protein
MPRPTAPLSGRGTTRELLRCNRGVTAVQLRRIADARTRMRAPQFVSQEAPSSASSFIPSGLPKPVQASQPGPAS